MVARTLSFNSEIAAQNWRCERPAASLSCLLYSTNVRLCSSRDRKALKRKVAPCCQSKQTEHYLSALADEKKSPTEALITQTWTDRTPRLTSQWVTCHIWLLHSAGKIIDTVGQAGKKLRGICKVVPGCTFSIVAGNHLWMSVASFHAGMVCGPDKRWKSPHWALVHVLSGIKLTGIKILTLEALSSRVLFQHKSNFEGSSWVQMAIVARNSPKCLPNWVEIPSSFQVTASSCCK